MQEQLPLDGVLRQLPGVDEGLQQVDRRNADDGHRQLHLEHRGVDMVQPFRLIRMLFHPQARDKGFVAAHRHHQQQVGDHHHVNQPQHGEHDLDFGQAGQIGQQLVQLGQKLLGVHPLHDNQPEINRQLQPAAPENHPGQAAFRGAGEIGAHRILHDMGSQLTQRWASRFPNLQPQTLADGGHRASLVQRIKM